MGRFIAVAIVIGSAVVAACFSQPTRPSGKAPTGDGGPGDDGGVPDGDGDVQPPDDAECVVETFDTVSLANGCGDWAETETSFATISRQDGQLQIQIPSSPAGSAQGKCSSLFDMSLDRASVQLVQAQNHEYDAVTTYFRFAVGGKFYGFELANSTTSSIDDAGVEKPAKLTFRCGNPTHTVTHLVDVHKVLELRRTGAQEVTAFTSDGTSAPTQFGPPCSIQLEAKSLELRVERGSGNHMHTVKFDELRLCPTND